MTELSVELTGGEAGGDPEGGAQAVADGFEFGLGRDADFGEGDGGDDDAFAAEDEGGDDSGAGHVGGGSDGVDVVDA